MKIRWIENAAGMGVALFIISVTGGILFMFNEPRTWIHLLLHDHKIATNAFSVLFIVLWGFYMKGFMEFGKNRGSKLIRAGSWGLFILGVVFFVYHFIHIAYGTAYGAETIIDMIHFSPFEFGMAFGPDIANLSPDHENAAITPLFMGIFTGFTIVYFVIKIIFSIGILQASVFSKPRFSKKVGILNIVHGIMLLLVFVFSLYLTGTYLSEPDYVIQAGMLVFVFQFIGVTTTSLMIYYETRFLFEAAEIFEKDT